MGAGGLNRRRMRQVPAGARVVPQPPASLVNPVPATTMLAIDSVPSPVFVSVPVCVAEVVLRFTFPKSTLVLDRLATGAAPLPVTATVRSGALVLATVIEAVTAAFVVGKNLTLKVHVALCTNDLPAVQVLPVDTIVKAALPVMFTGVALRVSVLKPMLVTVTGSVVVVLIVRRPKASAGAKALGPIGMSLKPLQAFVTASLLVQNRR